MYSANFAKSRITGTSLLVERIIFTIVHSSSKEHQSTDWSAIHVKICQLLIPLRTPSKVLGSEEERKRRESNMRKNEV